MEEVLSLESSPDYLCVGSSSSANVFSLASLDPSAPGPHSVTLHTESEVIASAFLAESKQSNNAVVAATAHLDGKIRIFRTPFISTDGSPIEAEAHSTIAAHDGSVNSISTSATDGNLLASVGEDCALNVWDLQRGDHVANLQLPEGGLMVRWLPDGLLVADRSGSISLFDVRLRSQRPVSCIATGEPLADCDWSPLAVCWACVLDVCKGVFVRTATGLTGGVLGVCAGCVQRCVCAGCDWSDRRCAGCVCWMCKGVFVRAATGRSWLCAGCVFVLLDCDWTPLVGLAAGGAGGAGCVFVWADCDWPPLV
ncbi:hypothetical protein PAPYR_4652 [Paratrimastix pyriformis]|uniref:Uncharacterized protein n=1 Tax=Paratrimastix pyriformis TaxID=342808 RepID=A0ABQ8UKL3_9EUKA|nr:hypothetical protein PAPYR_4652 [Paratrimastix pyriformis]